MKITTVHAVYFSPTGNTKKIAVHTAKILAEKLSADYHNYDFTSPTNRCPCTAFNATDLVIFAVPVYAGRVPNKVLPLIRKGFSGGNALAVPIVTWGNRNFDNALIELRNELEALQFHTIAGIGAVASHAMSDRLAVGRPNEQDLRDITDFAEMIAKKILRSESIPKPVGVRGDDPVGPYYTPLGLDGQPAKFLKAKPFTDPEKCTHCGLCASICPMGSISPEDHQTIDGICIKCHACIRRCPNQAKYFDDENLASHIAYLEAHYADLVRESEFYI